MISFFIILLLLPLSLYLFAKKLNPSSPPKPENLPPGPRPWPVIGNIPNLIGKNPHIIVANLAKAHGPLMSLRLGSQLLIMGSSPEAASQILKTHDRDLSARYTAKATPIKEADLMRYSILWAPECNHHWKTLRSIWRGELFGPKALESNISMREKKIAEMVEFLRGKEGETVDIGHVAFAAVFNSLGHHCFSRDMVRLGDEETVRDWKETIWKFMEAGTTPTVADFFPAIGGLGIQNAQRNKTLGYLRKMFGRWGEIIGERKKIFGSGSGKHGDFLEFMLENGFSDDQMLHMLLEIFPAACGNLTATIEWAMAELLNNRAALNNLLQELHTQTSISTSNSIKESEIPNLPYLNACIKETLRLHPPIAFVPHLAAATCTVLDYTVPEGSLIMMNLWALGRDPDTFSDPFDFRPERFLESGMDYQGVDFGYLPFGGGRRMCPGLNYAAKQVHCVVAALVGGFEWEVPEEGEVDMGERYGVPVQKDRPLVFVPTNKF